MAKMVLLCFRDGCPAFGPEDLEQVSRRLVPDNIVWPAPRVLNRDGLLLGVFNPGPTLRMHAGGLCLGSFFGRHNEWWTPLSDVPDGTYALVRADSSVVELVSDAAASRTIWYVLTDDIFLASTSQRALVCFLGDVQFDVSAAAWMLSCGNLGGRSWDRRIGCLPPDARLVLDRRAWQLNVTVKTPAFEPRTASVGQHEGRYRLVLQEVLSEIDAGRDRRWALMLSGGLDSRTLLLMLKNGTGLQCVTWGLASQALQRENDVWVAGELARRLDLEHRVFETDMSPEPVATILQRFLGVGEGRVDHVAAYMDGFRVWKQLFESGVAGVIRGDQGSIESYFDCWLCIGGRFLADYSNLRPAYQFGMGTVTSPCWPEELKRKNTETLPSWRDRLHHMFRLPYVMAALTELKAAYVEVMNPFLSRRILSEIRQQPDDLRGDKKLFRKVVSGMGPPVPLAAMPANAGLAEIVRSERVVAEFDDTLSRPEVRALFSDNFIDAVLSGLSVSPGAGPRRKKTAAERLKAAVPMSIKNILKSTIVKQHMDPNLLALRVYIIAGTYHMLHADAAMLQHKHAARTHTRGSGGTG